MVSTHLKNISQIRSFPQIGVKIKNTWNHQPRLWINILNPLSLSLFGISMVSSIGTFPPTSLPSIFCFPRSFPEFSSSRLVRQGVGGRKRTSSRGSGSGAFSLQRFALALLAIVKIGVSQNGKILLKWMIWRYPYFWKHPNGYINPYWDVLLVLDVNGLFHPYILVGYLRPLNGWNKPTY